MFFQDFNCSRSLKCPLHIGFYALRVGVSVMELKCAELFINHTIQRKHYISIAHTGNFIMYMR